jgi:hypothetical protein
MKTGVSLLRCGKCGKPFNPFGSAHVCNGARKGRTKLSLAVSLGDCPTCGRPRGNPLTHTCTVKTDFKARHRAADRQAAAERRKAKAAAKRRAEAERRKAATARRRAKEAARRKAAADRRKAAADAKRKAPARPARPPHDYRSCTDHDCRRYACLAWKEAFQEGRTTGLDDGWDIGYDAAVSGRSRDHD